MITRETTMWKAWVGSNASDSYGAILFGAVYGYLSLTHSAFLFLWHRLLGVPGGQRLSVPDYVAMTTGPGRGDHRRSPPEAANVGFAPVTYPVGK